MFQKVKNYGLGLICFFTCSFYLTQTFVPSDFLHWLYSLLAGVLLVFAIFSVRRMNQVTAIILVVLGTIIFLQYEVEVDNMLISFGKNINLLTIFLFVPFFGVIISIGGYLTALKQKVQEQKQKSSLYPYKLSYILNASMGVILNLGSIPIAYRIAEESFSQFKKKKMGIMLLRSFGFCMFWSPYFVNVGLVLVLFNISWIEISWIGILMAIVYLVVSLFFFKYIRFSNDQVTHQKEDKKILFQSQLNSRKLFSLAVWSLSLLLLSFLLDFWLEVNMLTIVSMLAIGYPLLWATAIGVIKEYMENIINIILDSFDRLKNEIVIFISAGYFGVSLSYTTIGEVISQAIFDLSFGSIYFGSILIILFSVILALTGIHPVIVIIGIGSSL